VIKRRFDLKSIVGDLSENPASPASPFLTFAQKNLSYIAAAIIVIFLSLSVFLAWKYFDGKKENQAMIAYFQAYKSYEKSIKEDRSLDQPLQLFQATAEEYQGTSAEVLSFFYIGNCQFAMKNYDSAIDSYHDFLQSVSDQTNLVLLACDSLGYCYEEKKDFSNAIKYFKKTIVPPPGLGEDGCLNIARCYESIGDKENSLTFYNKVIVEYPDSSNINFVREKIRLLQSMS